MASLEPLDRPHWLSEPAWPWPTGSLPTPAGRIAVTDAGSGPLLLLVHTGTWSFVWRDLLRELTPHFRCIALDASGCGRSERLSTHRATLAASATAVGSVIDRLDLHGFTLVAHDLGGPSGLGAAAERPERIRGIVAVNAFGWRPANPVLRGALAVMGSPPVRPARPARRPTPADRLRSVQRPFRFQRQWQARFPEARQHVVRRGNHYPMCDDPRGVAEAIRHLHATEVVPDHTSELTTGPRPAERGGVGDTLAGTNSPL